MRKALPIVLFLVFISLLATPYSFTATEEIPIYINGKRLQTDTPAVLVNDRTMVPLRVIAETFNAEVAWNETSRTVTIDSNGQNNLNLLELNGEKTTWPYWHDDKGLLYLEYRNVVELLRIKYKAPWYSVTCYPEQNVIMINGKKTEVEMATYDGYNAISMQSLIRGQLIDFEWDEEGNLIVNDL